MKDPISRDALFYRDMKKTYLRMERGEGIYLYDQGGRRYIDGCGGAAVVNIGHGVPEVIEAMTRQARKATFIYSGLFTNEPAVQLSGKLIGMAPPGMSKVLLLSGGSEATESAIKIARQYHLECGNASKYKVIARRHSYHGNTLGALSLSGRVQWRQPFVPYLQDFPHIDPPYCYRCPYGKTYPSCGIACADDLERMVQFEGPEYIAAFIAEPIVGASLAGVTPPPEYYEVIRRICDRYNILMIADEIITGVGRTGRNFGMDHWRITPDLIVTGKGLSGGYAPLAAVLVHEKVGEAVRRGSGVHTQGYTYAANPLSAAVGVAVLEYIEKHDLIRRSARMGARLVQELDRLRGSGIVGDIRGRGLLVGIELVRDPATKAPFPSEAHVTARVVDAALRRGLSILPGMEGIGGGGLGDQILLTPPFIITEDQVREMADILVAAAEEVRDSVAVGDGCRSSGEGGKP